MCSLVCSYFEAFILLVVLFNTVVMAVVGPNPEKGTYADNFSFITDLVCLQIYT